MYSSTLPSTSTLHVGGWSAPRPGRFTPGKDPVPIVQEAGWAPGPVWTGAENLVPPTGIRSLDRPARSESLYRLSYRGPHISYKHVLLLFRFILNNLIAESTTITTIMLRFVMLGCTQALYEIVPFQSDKIHYFHYVLDPPQYFKQFNQRQQSPF